MKQKYNATAAYTMLQIATWGFYAVILSFSSNVLYDFGFLDSQISILLGISTAVSFVMQLAAAELVSRRPGIRVFGIMAVLGCVMILGNLVVWMPGMPAWLAIGAFAVACMILQMLPSLANAMGMDAIKRGSPTNYSIARGMGSLGYSVLAYVTGILVRSRGSRMVPVMGGACAVILTVAVVWYHFAGERGLPESVKTPGVQTGGHGFLGQYPRFTVFLVGSVFLQFSHNLLSNFMYQIMLVKNGGAGEQGTATAICALVELPVMFFFPLLMRKIRCDKWVRFASLFITVKALGIFLAATPYGVYVAQATQMLGYGLYTISSVNYAEMVVGRGESVRAQSYLGATSTVGGLLASATGGIICQYFGAQTMVLVSLAAGLAGGITIALTAQKTKE